MKSKIAVTGLHIYFLLFALFIGFTTFLVAQYNKVHSFEGVIGDYNFYMIKSANKAESALLYIDQSAKYSLQQAIYELANDGGISEIEFSDTEIPVKSDCGKFDDANVWFMVTKNNDEKVVEDKCFDPNLAGIHIEYEFNKNLNQYFSAYPGSIPMNNYDYEITDSLEIIARAKDPLKINILKKEVLEAIEKPLKEASDVEKYTSMTPEGLKDFSGTSLCAKGISCLLTEDALKLALEAEKNAQRNEINLEITSSYRSYAQQKALWEGRTTERWAQRYPDENARKAYVSNPDDCKNICPHFTGSAVDVRFKGMTAKTMTAKDWQLLHKIMTDAGWVRYSNEPWHFECCGTDRYARAKAAGVTAIV